MHSVRRPALSFLSAVSAAALLVFSSGMILFAAVGPASAQALAQASTAAGELSPIAGTVFRDCVECPDMVMLPPGQFLMGSPESDAERWSAEREGPVHEVTVARAFAIGRYEITRAQFAQFVAESGYIASGCLHWTGAAWVNDPVLGWRNPGYE